MDHFSGLHVSFKDTSVGIMDGVGKVVGEVRVASEPQVLLPVLRNGFERIELEAGPLWQWLYGPLAEAGLPGIGVETRHMRSVPSTARSAKYQRSAILGLDKT